VERFARAESGDAARREAMRAPNHEMPRDVKRCAQASDETRVKTLRNDP
jgi:hypothetical protein